MLCQFRTLFLREPADFMFFLLNADFCHHVQWSVTWRKAWQPTPLFLLWESPWKEEPGRWQRVGNDWATKHSTQISVTWSVQFSSVAQSCLTLRDPMNRSTPGLPVHHQLPEFTQTFVHQVSDPIQPSHPLSSPSPPAPNPSQHQGLSQWVNSWHEVAKVLQFQLQHQSFQWTPRTDLL